jgi:hypothetical protein
MQANVNGMARPNAAHDIVQKLLELSRDEVVPVISG